MNRATCEAFCSTANLGPGFDCFGLALNKYSDRVRVMKTQLKKLRLVVKGRYSKFVFRDLGRNSAGPPARELYRNMRKSKGLLITVDKGIPQGLGLGSSGASAAACTKALDHLLGLELSNDDLVRVGSLGEKAVSGTAHADNVAASILGGFVVVFGDPIRAVRVNPPPELRAVVAVPRMAVPANKTRQARGVVPRKIETRKAVLNVGRATALALGFARRDMTLIRNGMDDEIAEPHRRRMIPGFEDVKRLALRAGAVGVAISGAGPSIVAIVDGQARDPRIVSEAMVKGFDHNGVKASAFVAGPAEGARILSSR